MSRDTRSWIAIAGVGLVVIALLAAALVVTTRNRGPADEGMSDAERRCYDIAAIRWGGDMGTDEWVQSELDECLAEAGG